MRHFNILTLIHQGIKNSSDPRLVLENLNLENNHRLVIGNLNINSISNKFENLKLIIQGKTDILAITESKTDSTFPLNQFAIQGHSKTYKFDRNRNGGGVFYICSRRYSK